MYIYFTPTYTTFLKLILPRRISGINIRLHFASQWTGFLLKLGPHLHLVYCRSNFRWARWLDQLSRSTIIIKTAKLENYRDFKGKFQPQKKEFFIWNFWTRFQTSASDRFLCFKHIHSFNRDISTNAYVAFVHLENLCGYVMWIVRKFWKFGN